MQWSVNVLNALISHSALYLFMTVKIKSGSRHILQTNNLHIIGSINVHSVLCFCIVSGDVELTRLSVGIAFSYSSNASACICSEELMIDPDNRSCTPAGFIIITIKETHKLINYKQHDLLQNCMYVQKQQQNI